MENLLIEIYLFVCHVYDTSSTTCYQRLSNNREPAFTDQELITIWFFAHLEGCFEKKRMHRLILKYWLTWFPRLPSYQTFVLRLNRLEPTFQTFGAALSDALAAARTPEVDHLVDSLPVMLARHGHSSRARVGREVADIGFCAAKKTRFHGVAPAPGRTTTDEPFALAHTSVALCCLPSRLTSLPPTAARRPPPPIV